MSQAYPSDVTAIVCTWNSKSNVKRCLVSLRNSGVGELIVVDATSTDGTREIAEEMADRVLTDPRKGLALARNVGLSAAARRFVLFPGPDNIFPAGTIEEMLRVLVEGGYSGVSARTELEHSESSYLNQMMNLYKIARYFPGPRSVIGTPTLFPRGIIQRYGYDERIGYSDDSDLCDRMYRDGHRFAICDAIVLESGSQSWRNVWERWAMYGVGDFQYYMKYSPQWSWRRKIQSWLHPLKSELLGPFRAIHGIERMKALPFLVLITLIRYSAWLRKQINKAERSAFHTQGSQGGAETADLS